MEKKEINVFEWQQNYKNGMYDAPDFTTQVNAGWYDWFCKETSLATRLKKMAKLVLQVRRGGKIDLDNMYVWFKNNCPLCGPLYDDFRFADIETGDTMFTIKIDDKRTDAKYEVWCIKNDFKEAYISFDNSRELINWLNTPWEE